MSVEINSESCVSCGQCAKVCPGTLIEVPPEAAARLVYPQDCWGCGACLKACPQGALKLCLSPALGGRGGRLGVQAQAGSLQWRVTWPGGETVTVDCGAGASDDY
jgi:adenylylsulfate reductase subunit B